MKKVSIFFSTLLLLLLVGCSLEPPTNKDSAAQNPLQWCDLEAETNSLIVKVACAEVAELRVDSLSDLEKIRSLRAWVARWWPYFNSNLSDLQSEFWKIEPEALFRSGREGRYGGVCASTAWMLMHVYNKFGLETWVYNFGNPAGNGTHVVTLVKVDGVVILQDAYLNAELSHTDGSTVDFRRAMNLSFLRQGESKATLTYKQSVKRCLGGSPEDCVTNWIFESEEDVKCKSMDGSPKTYLCDVSNFDGRRIMSEEGFWGNVEDFLGSQKFNPGIENLMLFPINLTGVDGIAITDVDQISGTTQVLFNEIASAAKGKF
jgi:hypothetical protein